VPRLVIDTYDDPENAARYGKRPATMRAEARALHRLLPGDLAGLDVLDVPCGNGRLGPLLRALGPRRVIGVDGAAAMARRAGGYDAVLVGDAAAIPLGDAAVDVTICMRLLHHFPAAVDRAAILGELARVTRRFVVFSFYRAATLEGLRRRCRRRPSARVGFSLRRIRSEAAEAGLRVIRAASLLPLVREQTLVLAAPVHGPFTGPEENPDACVCSS
jgi:SAM-dependent methyltransferase